VSEFWGIKPWGKDCWCRHYTGVGRLGGESIGSEVWGRKFCGVKYIGVYVKYIGLGSIKLGGKCLEGGLGSAKFFDLLLKPRTCR
jgi:hypothetical protein